MVKKSLRQEVAELKEQLLNLQTQLSLLTILVQGYQLVPPPVVPVPYTPPISPTWPPVYPITTCNAGQATCKTDTGITVWNSTNRVDSQYYNQNVQ